MTSRELLGVALVVATVVLLVVGEQHGWHVDPPNVCLGWGCP